MNNHSTNCGIHYYVPVTQTPQNLMVTNAMASVHATNVTTHVHYHFICQINVYCVPNVM